MPPSPPLRLRSLAPLCALLCLLTGPLCAAQDVDAGASEVEIKGVVFGVGETVRPGAWAGVRLTLRDRGDRVRAALVRLHIEDPDGDTALHQRLVTLNPGREQEMWLYARLPYDAESSQTFTVTVRLAPEGEAETAGRRIGAARIQPRRVVPPTSALIGIVGRRSAGLDQYAATPIGTNRPGTAHELTETVLGLEPASMPDDWRGLAAMEALVWLEGDPLDLTDEAAQAIREWVHRGGQLVVALPPVGETWSNARNPLIDLVPEMTISRQEGVDLEQYREMLTGLERLPLPDQAVVHTFTARDGASVSDATPVLAGSDGRTLVMRRILGAGMSTFIGIDLGSSRLAGRLDAHRLWHRILGRRFTVMSPTEMQQRRQSEPGTDFTSRDEIVLDADIGSLVNMTGRAGAGVLLAVIVFAAYLLLAGPGGFAMLKMRGREKHAWVAFVCTAAIFAVAAWSGATALRPSLTEIRHVTLIDHVFAQPVDRARTWFSVILPTYGAQRVSIGPGEGASERWANALSPWDDPEGIGKTVFPDRREYVINSRQPGSIEVPTRSTVKQFRADWLGPPPLRTPVPVGGQLYVDSSGALVGTLEHELDAPLEEVQIVLVRRQTRLGVEGLPAETVAWSLPDAWAPRTPLDLEQLGDPSDGEELFRVLAERTAGTGGFGALARARSDREARRRVAIAAWMTMLEPPNWRTMRGGVKTLLQRRETLGWDLGEWFTQPCLIIVGQMEGETPTPIEVDGREPASRGLVVLRWIYPLAARPAWASGG